MENKLEQLKHWLKDEQANALLRVSDYRKMKETEGALMVQGEVVAFALVIEKVNEIFKSECSSVAEVKEKSFMCKGYLHKMKCVTQCEACRIDEEKAK